MAFTYAPGRGGQHVERISRGFGGILQVDGYAGYNRLIAPDRIGPGIQLAYCWAHARRKLIEITRNGSAPIAEDGVALIRALYAIEADIRGSDPATRLAARQERSAPVLTRIEAWLSHHRARASAKSRLGEALAYIAQYRNGLGHFLTDGHVELDSNIVARTIRPIARNRKRPRRRPRHRRRKFCRHRLAHRDLQDERRDPHAWLTITLTAIVKGHKQSQIQDLFPWNYAPTV